MYPHHLCQEKDITGSEHANLAKCRYIDCSGEFGPCSSGMKKCLASHEGIIEKDNLSEKNITLFIVKSSSYINVFSRKSKCVLQLSFCYQLLLLLRSRLLGVNVSKMVQRTSAQERLMKLLEV
jgi:hypothetical protein